MAPTHRADVPIAPWAIRDKYAQMRARDRGDAPYPTHYLQTDRAAARLDADTRFRDLARIPQLQDVKETQ